MKILRLLPLALLFLLVGCQDKPIEGENYQPNDDADLIGVKYDFFELEVNYGDPILTEFRAAYEKEANGLEAEIYDQIHDVYMDGDEAFTELSPDFQQLDLSPDTARKEAIQQVLTAFELEEDYKSISLDVRFPDGEELEFEVEE